MMNLRRWWQLLLLLLLLRCWEWKMLGKWIHRVFEGRRRWRFSLLLRLWCCYEWIWLMAFGGGRRWRELTFGHCRNLNSTACVRQRQTWIRGIIGRHVQVFISGNYAFFMNILRLPRFKPVTKRSRARLRKRSDRWIGSSNIHEINVRILVVFQQEKWRVQW